MSKRIWFYYAKEVQVGPLTFEEIKAAVEDAGLAPTDFIFREGFADWVPLRDVPELHLAPPPPALRVPPPPKGTVAPDTRRPQVAIAKKEFSSPQRHPRAPLSESAIAHNDLDVARGRVSNISLSGVFFETDEKVFQINDEVKLTLKQGGLGKPLNLRGVVVRLNRDARFPQGYGLELSGVDEVVRARIDEYVKRNKAS